MVGLAVLAQKSSPALPPHVGTHSLAPLAAEFVPKIPPQALTYQRTRRVVSLVGMVWGLAGPLVFVGFGLGRRLARRLKSDETPPKFRKLLMFYALFILFESVWTLPFGLYGLHLERVYGFSTQSLSGYFADRFIGDATDLIFAPLIWLSLLLYVRSPKHWWKIAWAGLVPLILFSIVIEPIVIAPLYNRFTPMPTSPLKTQIETLASKAGISGSHIFIENTSSRTRHVNAYVTGLGPTTRIVINDTALKLLPPDQTLAMVGHEMGHYVEGHLWYGFLSGSLGAGAFLFLLSRLLPVIFARYGTTKIGAKSPAELSAVPVLLWLISVFLIVQSPIESAISRGMEHRADRFGLRVTGLHESTARLFVGFAERDYSEPDPPLLLHLWFGSHPTLKERITFALSGED